MANPESADAPRRKGRRKREQIGSEEGLDKWRGDIEDAEKPSLEELRNLRNELYSGGSTERRTVHASRMAASLSRSSLSKSSSRHKSKSGHAHRSEVDPKPHQRRRRSSRDEESAPAYVYGPPKTNVRSATVKVSEKRPSRLYDSDSSTGDGVLSVVSEESEYERKTTKVKVVQVKGERTRSSSIHGGAKEDARVASKSSRRSYISTSRPNPPLQPLEILRRTLSGSDSRAPPRSTPKRSHSVTISSRPSKSPYEPSMTSTRQTKRSSGILGLGLWRSQTEKKIKPVRLVTCLTCFSDDTPRDKSAKLQCGHYMCHACLKRIFELSVKDPQHMPPKCCTSDHIPLKHVDRLFNNDFKKLWNKKHIEYTTKNRMYCPGKRCGEWINPKKHFHVDRGTKYAQCGSCNTKICCQCNGKWHGKKDCPKDEETKALLETAKQAGWQRCYSCRTLVELKEGCNHMTCRCKAEFCMICGVKWKTCNCPWFNYEQVENDRIQHMNVPGDIPGGGDRIPERARPGQGPGRPRLYHREPAGVPREVLDEQMAWRMLNLGIIHDDNTRDLGGMNLFAQHRNENRGPAPRARRADMIWEVGPRGAPPLPPPLVPPPPPIRHRPSLNPRPPLGRAPGIRVYQRPGTSAIQGRPSLPRRTSGPMVPPRRSELAGLRGNGNRVGNWRAHVEPGVTPEEGVLST